jgi:TRAP-type C4-dicarboxylate transport system permease small subunit
MVSRLISRIEDFLCIGLFGALFVLWVAHIFCRYVLNAPLVWSEEIALDLFIWVIFLGSSLAIRKRSHLVVDPLWAYLQRKPPAGQILNLFIKICLLGLTGLLWVLGFLISINSWSIPSAALQWPLSVFYLAIPFSCTFMIFWLFLQTKEIILELKKIYSRSRRQKG